MFVTNDPISLSDFFEGKLEESCGAMASFVGVVRNHHGERRVKRLYYDCYQNMAEKEIRSIIEEIKREYPVKDIKVLHRVGWLEVGEVAVAIMVSSAHRDEAFSACRAVIDRIKERVPLWKKEVYLDDTFEWISCVHSAEVIHDG